MSAVRSNVRLSFFFRYKLTGWAEARQNGTRWYSLETLRNIGIITLIVTTSFLLITFYVDSIRQGNIKDLPIIMTPLLLILFQTTSETYLNPFSELFD